MIAREPHFQIYTHICSVSPKLMRALRQPQILEPSSRRVDEKFERSDHSFLRRFSFGRPRNCVRRDRFSLCSAFASLSAACSGVPTAVPLMLFDARGCLDVPHHFRQLMAGPYAVSLSFRPLKAQQSSPVCRRRCRPSSTRLCSRRGLRRRRQG